jgi:hypothetical protein
MSRAAHILESYERVQRKHTRAARKLAYFDAGIHPSQVRYRGKLMKRKGVPYKNVLQYKWQAYKHRKNIRAQMPHSEKTYD